MLDFDKLFIVYDSIAVILPQFDRLCVTLYVLCICMFSVNQQNPLVIIEVLTSLSLIESMLVGYVSHMVEYLLQLFLTQKKWYIGTM